MNTIKKFALPGFAVLAFLALIVGLIGALGGPSRASVTDLQTAVTNLQTAVNGLDTSKANASDLTKLQTAVTNLQTAVNVLDTFKANASDLTNLQTAVTNLQTAVNGLDSLEPAAPAPTEPAAAPTTEPAAAPTAQPTAQGQAGWANLPNDRQAWIGPEANVSVHIEFVNVDPAATEAQIGLAGGEALHAFAAMGGNAHGCEVQVAPMRDKTILSCPVTIVQFALAQDGELVTVSAPQFGASGYLTFSEVATLLRQSQISRDNPLLIEPKSGFFLAWVSTAPISGLYIP